MESEILKIICANQGSVDTDYLILNLGLGDATYDIISNQDRFALSCPFGQPKVVARTRLKLCRVRECPGSCRALHLCKKFLLTGSCPFTRTGCRFSHELDSDHNAGLLREHELESLSRAELCTLLLQSDNWLLPDICHNYNNGGGEFGLCQEGFACKRLHICERFLNRDCTCSKAHDFNAPQPYKSLQEKGVPEDLTHSLKSVYANILALKYTDRRQQNLPNNTDANSNTCCNRIYYFRHPNKRPT
uniref:C3H1-type domain-containing protein n=1 Tax=Sander lucioperca TaxID=283035 RepID=A0A8C9Z4B1_SANLU